MTHNVALNVMVFLLTWGRISLYPSLWPSICLIASQTLSSDLCSSSSQVSHIYSSTLSEPLGQHTKTTIINEPICVIARQW
jgi:hypothetical protein